MTGTSPRFHLAIPVHSLAAAREFYGDKLGCAEGRSSDAWVDFNLGGHQLVCHLVATEPRPEPYTSPVDGEAVPVPHFGLVLSLPEWKELTARLEARGVEFAIPPHTRFAGTPGEQGTFFSTTLPEMPLNSNAFPIFLDYLYDILTLQEQPCRP